MSASSEARRRVGRASDVGRRCSPPRFRIRGFRVTVSNSAESCSPHPFATPTTPENSPPEEGCPLPGSPALVASGLQVRPWNAVLDLTAQTHARDFATSLREGLSHRPRRLECRFLYDAVGSKLFEAICELPEYYLTRTEDAILRHHAHAMPPPQSSRLLPGDRETLEIVELGGGSSSKIQTILRAVLDSGRSCLYIPIDVSPTALQAAVADLARHLPRVTVNALAADYEVGLGWLKRHPTNHPRMIVFLGSTLGNFEDDEAVALLRAVRAALKPGDAFLLGTDLAKPPEIVQPAYDDHQGLTERFIRNVLDHANRELDTGFRQEDFLYRVTYRPDRGRVEMALEARRALSIPLGRAASKPMNLDAGETVLVEISRKFTLDELTWLAREAGFIEDAAWTDPKGWFRVQRWRPS